jgi:hypothetical protein
MAKRSRKEAGGVNGLPVPDWTSINPDAIFKGDRTYAKAVEAALYYIHYEVGYPDRAKAFLAQAVKLLGKARAKPFNALPVSDFIVSGKLAYLVQKGGVLDDDYQARMLASMERLEARAKKLHQEKSAQDRADRRKEKNAEPKRSIQGRMLDQIEELGGNIDEAIDQWASSNLKLADFDPYRMIQSHQPEVKAPQARLLRGFYERAVEEAQLVKANKDPEIREAYGHLTAVQRREYLEIYERVITACDTVINARKAARKPKIKKPTDKTKAVAKLKFKVTEPSLGLASINPIQIMGADELWVYDTRTRKLGVYRASTPGSLGVKGTTILGYDEAKSTMRTVRKPDEVVKPLGKTTKARINKVYSTLTTTEARLRGRTNEHTILLKVV